VPVSLAMAVSGCSNIGPVSVTATPGSTAPEPSVTLPKISPVCCWALARALTANDATSARAMVRILIVPPARDCFRRFHACGGPVAANAIQPLAEHPAGWIQSGIIQSLECRRL
jgi:hypothetical protein